MRLRINLIAAFLVAGLAVAIAAPAWDAKDGVIFPPEKAKELLRQCSRGTPQNVTGYWPPLPAQIAQLEMLLPALLESKLSGQDHVLVQFYMRQYAGLTLKNRNIIYVNGFAVPSNDPLKIRASGEWRKSAVMVCDGGEGFFGVEYDPQTQTFESLAFNGVA